MENYKKKYIKYKKKYIDLKNQSGGNEPSVKDNIEILKRKARILREKSISNNLINKIIINKNLFDKEPHLKTLRKISISQISFDDEIIKGIKNLETGVYSEYKFNKKTIDELITFLYKILIYRKIIFSKLDLKEISDYLIPNYLKYFIEIEDIMKLSLKKINDDIQKIEQNGTNKLEYYYGEISKINEEIEEVKKFIQIIKNK